MRTSLLQLCFLLIALPSLADQSVTDSLQAILRTQPHDTVRASVFYKLSAISRNKGDLDAADSLATLGLKAAEASGSPKWMAELRISLAQTVLKRGQAQDVLRMRPELDALMRRANDQRVFGNYHTLIANSQRRIGDLAGSLASYLKALKHFEAVKDKRGIASCYNNIAIVHASQERFEDALHYFHLSTEMDRKIGIKELVATGLKNQAMCLFQMGKHHEAGVLLDTALTLFQQMGNNRGEAGVLDVLGVVHYYLKDYDKASFYFEKEMEMNKELGMDVSTAGCYINLGAVRTAQGRHREATPLINEGLRISLANGHKEYIRNGYEKLAEADSARGDMAAAFAHTKLARVYNDSIFNESITGQLAEMETRFETVQKEQEIVVLNKDNEIKQQQIRRQTLLRNGFIGGFAVMLLFSVIFFVQRNRIGKERDRSEELLLNILPYETAQELKAKGSSEARLIDQVTVLFTDFKGFTQMSETLSPQELVRDLNECFSAFDRICEKHGIEKIKTIGDAYMAAGGLPIPTDTHAVDVVRAALEMRNFIEEGKARKIEEGRPYFEIRIGIHTGPVVGGIVGIKKFQYDIWGDTVNTASRMESSGQVGQVNISGPTYELVKDTFACEFRGEVEAKGKGKLKMYFVG